MKLDTLKKVLDKYVEKAQILGAEYASLLRLEEETIAQISTLKEYMQSINSNVQEANTKKIYGDQLKNRLNFSEKIENGIRQQQHKLVTLERRKDAALREWNFALLDQRKMEKLIERKKDLAVSIEQRSEQKISDEYGARSHFGERV